MKNTKSQLYIGVWDGGYKANWVDTWGRKFEELYNYLLKVIEAYETSDTTSSNSVDINSDNYMM